MFSLELTLEREKGEGRREERGTRWVLEEQGPK